MLKLGVLILIVAGASAQPGGTQLDSIIRKCSKSDPNIDDCFRNNSNLAISDLNRGAVEDVNLPHLQGFDFGDAFVGLGEDLSFLLEDIKQYQSGLSIEKARLHFDTRKSLRRLDLSWLFDNVGWVGQYRAIGVIKDEFGNHKVDERGNATIYFGNMTINCTLDLKHRHVNGVTFLKAKSKEFSATHDKFDFKPSDSKGAGRPLGPEQFQQLEALVIKKAIEGTVKYITFAFNQILQEIPEDGLFLP